MVDGMASQGDERWTVIPDEGAVVVRLERPLPLVEWEPMLDMTHRYAMEALVVRLEGPGWLDPFARSMERALRTSLEEIGVTVVVSTAGV